jgi:hypothetical protein
LLEIRSERGERRDEAVVILERSEKSVTLTLLLRYSYARIVAIYWIAGEKKKWKGFLQANTLQKQITEESAFLLQKTGSPVCCLINRVI